MMGTPLSKVVARWRSLGLLGLLVAVMASPAAAQTPTNYSYDVHGRLVTSNSPSDSATYTYDNAGNRTQLAATAVTALVAGVTTASISQGSTNNPITFNLTGGPPVSITITAASHGTASLVGLQVYYTPQPSYVGPDTFNFYASNTCCQSTTEPVNITVNAAPLSASQNYSTWSWLDGSTSPNVVVTGVAGTAPYTYAWVRNPGGNGPDQALGNNSTSNTQFWTGNPPQSGKVFTSYWQCTVTDSAGHHATAPQVTVTFENDP